MKAQELIVSCFYNEEGESIECLIDSSFATILKRGLPENATVQYRAYSLAVYGKIMIWEKVK